MSSQWADQVCWRCVVVELFAVGAMLRQRVLELNGRLIGLHYIAPVVPVVDATHIEQVVSAWTGVPVERMSEDDVQRLISLPEALKVGGGLQGAWVLEHEGSDKGMHAAPGAGR